MFREMKMKDASCRRKGLILTKDREIIKILSNLLIEKNILPYISSEIEDLTNDYCIIIVGYDINYTMIFQKIKECKGILPHFIFLENGNFGSLNFPFISCKCKKISLPMEIFYLEHHIDEILSMSIY